MMYSSSPSTTMPTIMRSNHTMNHHSNTSFETSSFLGGGGNPQKKPRRRTTTASALWAKLATKCVVSSPLIVLVLFGILCLRWSSSLSTTIDTTTRQIKYSNVMIQQPSQQQQHASQKMKQTLLSNKRKSTTGGGVVVNDQDDAAALQQSQVMQENVVIQPRNKKASQEGVAGTEYVQDWNAQGMMNVQGQNTMMNVQQQQQQQGNDGVMGNVQGQNPIMAPERVASDGKAVSSVQGDVNAMVQQQQGNSAIMAATEQNAMTDETQQQQVMAASKLQATNKLSQQEQQDNLIEMNNPQGSTNTKTSLLGKNTRIMYYDPSSGNGIPDTVYDETGKAYSLASLQNENTEIYMERSLPQEELSLDIPDMSSWGHDQKQDNFIIVATVATMALLVGALSARRLRSRNFLNSCIENEEEVAYDSAYTSQGYDTFGPWKGDLEKFDV